MALYFGNGDKFKIISSGASCRVEVIQYYTVNFYDGETLVNTQRIPCGGSSSYVYEKDGYMFNEWTPEPTNITDNMDCYGDWEEIQSFGDASWEYIARISESGKAADVFSIGDEKDITVNYADGTSEIVTVQIADFNKLLTTYDVYDSSIRETAGIALVAKNILTNKKQLHSASKYPSSGRFKDTSLYSWLNGDFYNALQEDFKRVIKAHYTYNDEGKVDNGAIVYLPIMAYVQIPNYDNVKGWGDDYLTLLNGNAKRKKTSRGKTAGVDWWITPDVSIASEQTCYYVSASGLYTYKAYITSSKGIVPMFAI